MIDEYLKARKMGEKAYKAKVADGEYPFVPALDDIVPDNGTLSQVQVGLMEIPVDLIAGTKTRARQNSFAPDFMPLLAPETEFAAKWSNLYQAQMAEGFNSPIRVYEYLHRFYVLEGNKRVSVSRFLEMPVIAADVTRLVPRAEVLEAEPAYAEFMQFFKAAPVYGIECTQKGAYHEICEIAGVPWGETWNDDLVKALKLGFWRFARATSEISGKLTGMTMGDAFLIYLRIFRGDALGARESFVTGEGTVRRETPAQAIEFDRRSVAAWCGHPHFRIIRCEEKFEEKTAHLVREIKAFLGEPEPYETERKFLVSYPDPEILSSYPFCRKIEIEQTYLSGDGERARRRGENGDYLYFHTVKRDAGGIRRIEEERRITKEEYETLLADAEVGRGTVKKDRYCIVYKDKYFELDVYPIWRDRALLEIELSREDEEFELPDFLDVIREVTPEDEYKNYNIAKLFDKR